jgi:acyl-CoA thioesterase-1
MRRGIMFKARLLGVLAISAGICFSGCEQDLERSPTSSSRSLPGAGMVHGVASPRLDEVPDDRLKPERDQAPKIVAFGDSLTAGFGVTPAESYPAQLQRRLDEAGYRYRVVNAGVSGETTAGGLRRVDWILRSQPSIVILELGANDGLRGFDPALVRANLEHIIAKLQAAGVRIVLAGMKLPPNYGVEYTSRFTAIYPDLARKHQLSYMPFFLEGVGAQPTLNQPDGIHPTAPGYRIIVDHLMPVLQPLLEKDVTH